MIEVLKYIYVRTVYNLSVGLVQSILYNQKILDFKLVVFYKFYILMWLIFPK